MIVIPIIFFVAAILILYYGLFKTHKVILPPIKRKYEPTQKFVVDQNTKLYYSIVNDITYQQNRPQGISDIEYEQILSNIKYLSNIDGFRNEMVIRKTMLDTLFAERQNKNYHWIFKIKKDEINRLNKIKQDEINRLNKIKQDEIIRQLQPINDRINQVYRVMETIEPIVRSGDPLALEQYNKMRIEVASLESEKLSVLEKV